VVGGDGVEQRGGLFVPVPVDRRTAHPGAGLVYGRGEQPRLLGLDQDSAYEPVIDVASGVESDVVVIARRLRAL
jgi:hypothetical protein